MKPIKELLNEAYSKWTSNSLAGNFLKIDGTWYKATVVPTSKCEQETGKKLPDDLNCYELEKVK